jgi:hypothetical protein
MNWTKLVLACVAVVPCAWAQPEVITTGLQTPQKLVLTPGGNFLVTEPSMAVNGGRVSFVSRNGVRRSLLEGLPSGIDVVGGGTGPTAMALRDRTLYLAVGAGDIERRGEQPGTSQHNAAGISSPIFTSVLEFRFSQEIDTLAGAFVLTPELQTALADGDDVELRDGAGGTARASVLVDFPNSLPDANTIYRFSNPWSLALTPDGKWLYVTDASQDALVRVDTETGRWRRLVRFPRLPNVTPIGPPVVDAVPTSVRIYGDQVLISFLTGFPFAPGYARVLAVNPEARTTEPFIFNLTSAVDVLWRQGSDGRSQFFVLEFSQNQTAQPPAPGRLIRYDTPVGQVVLDDLRAPVSLALDSSTEDLFILELSGRILRLPIR